MSSAQQDGTDIDRSSKPPTPQLILSLTSSDIVVASSSLPHRRASFGASRRFLLSHGAPPRRCRWNYDYAIRLRPDVAYKRNFRLVHWPLFAPLLNHAVGVYRSSRFGLSGAAAELVAEADSATNQLRDHQESSTGNGHNRQRDRTLRQRRRRLRNSVGGDGVSSNSSASENRNELEEVDEEENHDARHHRHKQEEKGEEEQQQQQQQRRRPQRQLINSDWGSGGLRRRNNATRDPLAVGTAGRKAFGDGLGFLDPVGGPVSVASTRPHGRTTRTSTHRVLKPVSRSARRC